ncbi:glutathione S-transferase [Botrytis cinerea]
MSNPSPLVHFYDLSGPQPWSPACWRTRYALNYKNIPYRVEKLSYPSIAPLCQSLFPAMPLPRATVPIIQILEAPQCALNDSTPIAQLLNERFTEGDGYRDLKGVDEVRAYEDEEVRGLGGVILKWIVYDVFENALDGGDGSREYFRRTREEFFGCGLEDVGATYVDFYDAANVKWVGAASEEKLQKLMDLYGDDTFVKLMKKVEPWSR